MKYLKCGFVFIIFVNLTSCIVLTNASGVPRHGGIFDIGEKRGCNLDGVKGPDAPYVPESRLSDDDYVKQVLATKVREQKMFIDDLLSGELCQ